MTSVAHFPLFLRTLYLAPGMSSLARTGLRSLCNTVAHFCWSTYLL